MNNTNGYPLTRLHTIIERAEGEHKDYQYDGVKWCLQQENFKVGIESTQKLPNGGLLADEMGLGKTVTMLGTIIENFKRRTLIVLPVALLHQWKEQIHKFTGHTPLVFHGKNKHVHDSVLLYAPIVLTTYSTIAFNKKKQIFGRLLPIHWDRVIFDEAHHLRNSNTAKFAGAATLQADSKWFVTGTPIQNKRRDIVSISILLGVTPKQLVEEKMLRRTKEITGISIPPLILHTQDVQWTSNEERELAEEFHSGLAFSNVSSSKCGIVSKYLANTDNDIPLVAITRAKQICTMPSLLNKKLTQLVDKEIIQDSHPRVKGTNFTSKLDAVVDQIMINVPNNTQKIVFCSYRQEMDFLKQTLLQEGLHVEIVDGRSKKALKHKRHCHLDVLILQIQTCCEGLNLQSFSEVYFVTPHWNPFVEQQAIARCHRFGQQKHVHVYRFFMDPYCFTPINGSSTIPSTFDNHVASIQNKKMVIAEQILEPQ